MAVELSSRGPGARRAFAPSSNLLRCACVAIGLAGLACSSDSEGEGGGSGGSPGIKIPTGGGGPIPSNAGAGPYTLPAGYTKAELGGFKLGDAFSGDDPPPNATTNIGGDCGNTILGVVRDFNGVSDSNGHPDFESFMGNGVTEGLVNATLGSDRKPVYTGKCERSGAAGCGNGQQTTSKTAFDQWFRYAANVNAPFVVYLSLEPNNGVLTFQSHAYFPLDAKGLGNLGRSHNYHFTTEIHTQFLYQGGETFRFIGDDDVWVFLNNRLALDLGGLHREVQGTIELDAVASRLGLEKGKIYPLDLFHAERHTVDSNFRVDTNLRFTRCGEIVPEPPPR